MHTEDGISRTKRRMRDESGSRSYKLAGATPCVHLDKKYVYKLQSIVEEVLTAQAKLMCSWSIMFHNKVCIA